MYQTRKITDADWHPMTREEMIICLQGAWQHPERVIKDLDNGERFKFGGRLYRRKPCELSHEKRV